MSEPIQWDVIEGDSRYAISSIPDKSVDSVVTDPPYEIRFMGRGWDDTGIAYDVDMWRQCLRVLRSGGYLAAFGSPRTYHRLACAIEDAGFEIRDSIHWIYGSGMPHSANVSKQIDKKNGTTKNREVIHEYTAGGNAGTSCADKGGTYSVGAKNSAAIKLTVERGGCEVSRAWDGWGTSLKPSHEAIVLARKPFSGAVAANVLKHGCGAINVDACRVATDWDEPDRPASWAGSGHSQKPDASKIAAPPGNGIQCHPRGRWPANVVFSEIEQYDQCPVSELRRQNAGSLRYFQTFKYSKKSSRKEREAGCEGLPVMPNGRRNNHPTVKPIQIMRWVVKLVTRSGGVVLDPFVGSGTTGCASVLEGMRFVGIELDSSHCDIARARIGHFAAQQQLKMV